MGKFLSSLTILASLTACADRTTAVPTDSGPVFVGEVPLTGSLRYEMD